MCERMVVFISKIQFKRERKSVVLLSYIERVRISPFPFSKIIKK